MKTLSIQFLALILLFSFGCKEKREQAKATYYDDKVIVDTLAESLADEMEVPYIEKEEISFNDDELENKTIYIKFTKPIYGYELMAKVEERHNETGHPAVLSFSKNEKKVSEIQLTDFWFEGLEFAKFQDGYILNSDFVPPNILNKGVIKLDTLKDTPFFFMDIDFDGEKEFIANYYGLGQRTETKYVPFQFPAGKILNKDLFDEIDSLTEIDFENKTIKTTSIISGALEWWITTYKKTGSKFSKTIEKHEVQYDLDPKGIEMIQKVSSDGTESKWEIAPSNNRILKK